VLGVLRRLQRPLTFDFCDMKLRDFAKYKLIIVVVVVVVNFISGLLNNISNKENNSKPENGHSCNKRYSLKHAHIAQAEKNYWQMIWKERMVSDQTTMMKSNLKKSVMTHFSDVFVITSPKNVFQITSQDFSFWDLSN